MRKVNKSNIYVFWALSSLIFTILQFIFVPRIDVDIKSSLPSDILWTATYEYSKEKLPSLIAYDIMQENGYTKFDGSISLTKVPIITDTISLSLETEKVANITEIKCKLYNIPFEILTGESLNAIISLDENGNSLYLQVGMIHDLITWCIIAFLCISLIVGYCILKIAPQIQEHLNVLYLLVSPILAFITVETISYNIWFLSWEYRIINYVFYLIIYLLIYIIIYQIKICTLIYNSLFLIIGIANYYILLFRGKPILPWDIYAVSTALSVAPSYVLTLTNSILFCIISNVFFVIILWSNKNIVSHVKHKTRVVTICIACPFLMGMILLNKNFKESSLSSWDTDIVYFYRTKGSFFSFAKYWADNRIQKPEGYSAGIWEELDNTLPQEKANEDKVSPQNILMIMNESLTDFGTVGDLETLPYLNSLLDRSIWGDLYVSVRGGSTCNTEFEVLTGNSLTFLPPNAFPFQSYINHPIPSIASVLESEGYLTEAFHLEQGKNWNRNMVYPKLGFNSFYDINVFENIETIRDRATDEYNYKQLINLVEESEDDKLFIFNTTIQNHGGYTGFRDLTQTFDLSAYGDFEEAEVYLSLIAMSDNAFEDLINYFSNSDEPTMIIMFGDHQPKLEEKSESFLLGKTSDDPLIRYKTPFIIWKNYEDKSKYIGKISSNYLPTLILEEANIELPIFHRFLKKLHEEFPVITLQGIIDKNGQYYTSIDEIADNPLIKTYEILQYSILFD